MSVSGDNASYRRGLLLGMTMAEIIVLIIFLLLLAFASLLVRERNAHQAQLQLIEKNKAAVERIIQVLASQEPDMSEELVRAVEALPNVIALMKKGQLSQPDESVEKVLVEAVDRLIAEKELAEKGQGLDMQKMLVESIQKQKELEAENKNLVDQKDNLVSQMKKEGRGVDSPPCWSDAVKNPEFIFKVDLNNSGIIVHDNIIPARVEEKSRLPIQNVKFDVLRTIPEFRSETRALFEWSKQKECRFFVLVYDKTGTSEKVKFKQLLRTVEEHFYKKLVDSAPSAEPDVVITTPLESSEEKDDSLFGNIFSKKKEQSAKKETYN